MLSRKAANFLVHQDETKSISLLCQDQDLLLQEKIELLTKKGCAKKIAQEIVQHFNPLDATNNERLDDSTVVVRPPKGEAKRSNPLVSEFAGRSTEEEEDRRKRRRREEVLCRSEVLDFLSMHLDKKHARAYQLIRRDTSFTEWKVARDEIAFCRKMSGTTPTSKGVLFKRLAPSILHRIQAFVRESFRRDVKGEEWATPEYLPILCKDAIETDPMKALQQIGYTIHDFEQIDKLALENRWWSLECERRRQSGILYKFHKVVHFDGRNDTAAVRDDLEACALDHAPPFCKPGDEHNIPLLVQATIDEMIRRSDLIAFETNEGWFVTVQEWAKCASIISNYALAGAIQTGGQEHAARVVEKIVEERAIYPLPTKEQVEWAISVLLSDLSVLTAPGGTGKTDYGLRMAYYSLLNEGYNVETIVPWHQHKKEIMRGLGLQKGQIHTLRSLTFVFDETGEESYKQSQLFWLLQSYKGDEGSTERKKLALVMDEVGVVGEKDFSVFINALNEFQYDIDLKLVLMGDHLQLDPIEAGCPFEDLVLSKAVPVHTFTTIFRSKNQDLSEFQSIYRPFIPDVSDIPSSWSLDARDTERYSLKGNTSVQFFKTAPSDVDARLGEVLGAMKHMGAKEEDVQVITKKNSDCRDIFQHVVRAVFRPEDEAMRFRDQEKHSGFLPSFATHDRVFYSANNTRFCKKGDEATICSVAGCHADSATATIRICMDEENDKLLMRIKEEEDKGDEGDVDFLCPFLMHLPLEYVRVSDSPTKTEWYFTLHEKDLKPASCLTFEKSQGLSFKAVVVPLKNRHFVSCRHLYVSASRPKETLTMLGPVEAFDNPDLHQAHKKRTTVLMCLLKHDKRVEADFVRAGVSPDTELVRKRSGITKELKKRTWVRHCGNSVHGKCYACGRIVDVFHFHCCHIVAHAKGGGLDDKNLVVGCAFCNLSAGTRNFLEYKQKMQEKAYEECKSLYGDAMVTECIRTIQDQGQTEEMRRGTEKIEALIAGHYCRKREKEEVEKAPDEESEHAKKEISECIQVLIQAGKVARRKVKNKTYFSYYSS